MALLAAVFVSAFALFNCWQGLGYQGSGATTPAWHEGRFMYAVNVSEYLEPFHAVDSRPMCREEKCSPQDCQLTSTLAFDRDIEKQVNCSCHIACYSSGRCCLNFEEVCLAGQWSLQWVVDTFPYEEDLLRLARLPNQKNSMPEAEYYKELTLLRTQMIQIREMRATEGKYLSVNKCPACDPSSDCQNIKDLCERTVLVDFVQFVPVIIHGQLYENKFCAQCSKAEMSSIRNSTDNIGISCNSGRGKLIQSYENGDYESILRSIAAGQCEIIVPSSFFRGTSTSLINPGLNAISVNFEIDDYKIIKQCDPRYKLLLVNYDEIDVACRAYSATLAYQIGTRHYSGLQNKHCTFCNFHPDFGDDDPACLCSSDQDIEFCVFADSIKGGLDVTDAVPFFRIVLDFTGSAKLVKDSFQKCGEREYLDVLKGKCIHPECPKGTFKYEHKCLSQERFDFTAPTPHVSDNKKTGLCISVKANNRTHDADHLMTSLNAKFNLFGGAYYVFSNKECGHFDGSNVLKDVGMDTLFYNLMPLGNNNVNLLKYFIEQGPGLISELEKDYSVSRVVMQYEGLSPCPFTHVRRVYTDFTIVWNGSGWLTFTDVNRKLLSDGMVYFDDMSMALNLTDASVMVSITQNGSSLQVDKAAMVCFVVDTTCPVEQNLSGDCSLPHQSPLQLSKRSFTWHAIFTLVCACLSCVALLLTLLLHVFIPNIMKIGGWSFLHLILSLLLAESCIITGSFIQAREGLLCSSFAAVQHFAWLSTFAWTAMLSWDLFKVFVLGDNTPHKWQKIQYPIVGWGLPALLVSACVGLHFKGFFQYGGNGSCWISAPIQLGLSFGLPIAAVIVFNATLYISIVLTLHRQMRSSADIGRAYDIKTRFVLYSKMSTVVGFTWIFGFFSNIESLRFMSYIFSASAGLNGVFLSASFTLSRTSIQIIKEKWSSLTDNSNVGTTT